MTPWQFHVPLKALVLPLNVPSGRPLLFRVTWTCLTSSRPPNHANATAALVFHYGGNDWSNAQAAALKAKFKELGIDVIAVTDAGVKPEKQVADIETVMAKKPDIIVSIPVDAIATAAAYKAAADKGVKLVFMDNVPKGFAAGKDYVSAVSADNYGNGVAAAHLMAKALGGKGDIGLVFHAADFFVTRQRYDGFKKTILEQYPDIKIIAEQ